MKLALASNFENEVENIEPIWNTFKDIIDLWVVVDSGSTDGTQEKLKELVGNKLKLVESPMIKTEGYGYARTTLVELAEGCDWVLIWDGDERMLPDDVAKVKKIVDNDKRNDLIFLPRCHYQKWDMSEVEYGSMDRVGNNSEYALMINPDYQSRLVRRIIVGGKSKVHWIRRVHEMVTGFEHGFKSLKNPVIRHFGFLKTDARKKQVAELCDKLWHMDLENVEIAKTYVAELKAGTADPNNHHMGIGVD